MFLSCTLMLTPASLSSLAVSEEVRLGHIARTVLTHCTVQAGPGMATPCTQAQASVARQQVHGVLLLLLQARRRVLRQQLCLLPLHHSQLNLLLVRQWHVGHILRLCGLIRWRAPGHAGEGGLPLRLLRLPGLQDLQQQCSQREDPALEAKALIWATTMQGLQPRTAGAMHCVAQPVQCLSSLPC